MRYHQCGSPLHQALQGVLNGTLRLGVQGRGGFVKNQNRRVLVERSGDGQALALSARELHGVVTDQRVDAKRELCHQIKQVGRLQAFQNTLAVHLLPQRDVDGNAVVEHQNMLTDQRKLGAQRNQIPVLQGMAIELDAARTQLDKARQQTDQRRLA